MTVFNGRSYLRAQLDSVLAQLQPGDELLIIDDASTDGGLQSLRSIMPPQLRIIINESNIGVVRSFERGLALARHDVVFLCDQDDIWLPGKRAAYVAAFEAEPAAYAVISDSEVIDAEGELLAPSYMATRGGFSSRLGDTLWRNRFIGCAMAVRRALLQIALPLPRKLPMHDMWLGALASIFGRVVYLPHPYLRYRRHAGNYTGGGTGVPWGRRFVWRLTLAWLLALRVLRVRLGLQPSGSR